jgi:hypothetical protein
MTSHLRKTCKQCGIEKSARNFYQSAQIKDGYMNTCCECHKAYVYANRELKKEQYAAKRRAYLAKPENYAKHLEGMRAWRRTERGKQLLAEGRKAWAVMHPEKHAAIVRAHQIKSNERRKLLRAQSAAA